MTDIRYQMGKTYCRFPVRKGDTLKFGFDLRVRYYVLRSTSSKVTVSFYVCDV